MLSQESFYGMCFPIVRVKFHGATNYRPSRWIATMVEDRFSGPKTYRATRSYDHSIGSGAINALPVAQEVVRKYFADWSARTEHECPNVQDYVFIPGEDKDSYVFTVINLRYFN